MNQLIPFQYDAHDVRVLDIDGEPWFVLADLCKVLDIANPSNVASRLDPEARNTLRLPEGMTGRGNPNATVVSEAGMYEVVIRSDKPEAAAFRRWITTDVLPSIRRRGHYGTPSIPDLSALSPDALDFIGNIGKALEAATREAKRNAAKAEAYDAFLDGSGCYLIDTAANLLGMRHKQLWAWLYDKKLLIKGGPRHRQPYANPRTKGWFAVKTYATENTGGKARTTTYLTVFGLDQVRQRLIREGLIASQLFALPSPAREEVMA